MWHSVVSDLARLKTSKPNGPLVIVVMDPLAKPLSCPCVAGYAAAIMRNSPIRSRISWGERVEVVFNESLVAAHRKRTTCNVLIWSSVSSRSFCIDAKAAGLSLKKVAMLSGKDGLTTQRGLVVVATTDPAKKISDLKDYRIYFGPKECDEKHAAAMALLKKAGVAIPAKLDTAVACDEGAVKILELAETGVHGCAVISSYAKPLLEGCGQVPKGALRVVGETDEIPFIVPLTSIQLDQSSNRPRSATDLLEVDRRGYASCESPWRAKRGFVVKRQIQDNERREKKVVLRGSRRQPRLDQVGAVPIMFGVVAWLPERLPENVSPLWTRRMSSPALAGVAATGELVVVADRDPADRVDIFRCYQRRMAAISGRCVTLHGGRISTTAILLRATP